MKRGPKPALRLVKAGERGRCGFPAKSGGACKRPAGWGTDRTSGPCRDHAPVVLKGGADAPAFLPSKAKELWEELAPRLRQTGRLEPEDEPGFLHLCVSHQLALHAAAVVFKEGLVDRDQKNANRRRKHPAFQLWRDAQAAFRAWAAEFGVTPAERARLDIPPPAGLEAEPADEMERLLRALE